MALMRSKNTKLEIAVRKLLHQLGIAFDSILATYQAVRTYCSEAGEKRYLFTAASDISTLAVKSHTDCLSQHSLLTTFSLMLSYSPHSMRHSRRARFSRIVDPLPCPQLPTSPTPRYGRRVHDFSDFKQAPPP